MKNSIAERKKKTLEGMNSRLNDTERRSPKSTGRQNKKNHPIITAKRKTNKKNANSLWDLWANIKHTNIHIIEVPEREEQENGIKSSWGNYDWILPKSEEENRYPGTENTEVPKQNKHRLTPRHIIIKSGKS